MCVLASVPVRDRLSYLGIKQSTDTQCTAQCGQTTKMITHLHSTLKLPTDIASFWYNKMDIYTVDKQITMSWA